MSMSQQIVEQEEAEVWARILDERERCALLCEGLAGIHCVSANRIRKDGSYTTRALWPFGKKITHVLPKWERCAKDIEAAANSLRVVAKCIRMGYDPRKIEPDPAEKITEPLWQPCKRCTSPMDCGSWASCEAGLTEDEKRRE